jgi:hypothetical protein
MVLSGATVIVSLMRSARTLPMRSVPVNTPATKVIAINLFIVNLLDLVGIGLFATGNSLTSYIPYWSQFPHIFVIPNNISL